MGAIKLILFTLTIISCSSYINAEDPPARKVICYVNNVAKYRKDAGKFIVDDIPDFCTHLVYSYVRISDDHDIITPDKDADLFSFKRFVHLKTRYPNVKFILSIQKSNAEWWFTVVNSAEIRKKLIENIIKFLRTYHFDGFEMDPHSFEWGENYKNIDNGLYGNFIKEQKEYLEEESKMSGMERLSYSIVMPEQFDFKFDVSFLLEYVDWITLTEYTKKPLSVPVLRHFSPLYAENGPSTNRTISYYLNHGGKPHKIAMAIPFFGKTYQLTSSDKYQYGQEAKGIGSSGSYTLVDGYMAYFEICRKIKDDGWTAEIDTSGNQGPFARHEDQWVSFDNENSIMKKAQFAKEKKLGAIVLLTLDLDDFKGYCSGVPFPLTKAAADTFLKA